MQTCLINTFNIDDFRPRGLVDFYWILMIQQRKKQFKVKVHQSNIIYCHGIFFMHCLPKKVWIDNDGKLFVCMRSWFWCKEANNGRWNSVQPRSLRSLVCWCYSKVMFTTTIVQFNFLEITIQARSTTMVVCWWSVWLMLALTKWPVYGLPPPALSV